MTGFSNEQMIEMVLEGQGKIQEVLTSMNAKMSHIAEHGCAHREDDLRRIQNLEGWRDKGIFGVITALFMALGALLGTMLGHK